MVSRLILVPILGLSLSGCALYAPSDGNPDGNAYLGNKGSVYEAAVNPAKNVGEVTYNPSAPLPETTQPPVANGSGMTAPPPPPAMPAPAR